MQPTIGQFVRVCYDGDRPGKRAFCGRVIYQIVDIEDGMILVRNGPARFWARSWVRIFRGPTKN